MKLKKHWNGQYGKSAFIKNGTLGMIELDMLKLREGEQKHYYETDNKEYGLIILGGKCSVVGEGFSFEHIGKRKNVFDGPAASVYLPRNCDFTVTAEEGEVEIAVAKCPAEKDFPPKLVNPEDVIIKHLGKDGWKREAHFNIDERLDANLIYIGEAWTEGGMWSSYPPHKHDDNNMPEESFMEELYFYRFDKPTGFGIQRVYTKEGDIDETYTVKNDDAVEIPRGYHPCTCAPGYKLYYLWIMAGKIRGFHMTTDEDHKWLNK